MAEFLCEYIADKLREISPETDEEIGDEEKRETKEALDQIERLTGYLLGRLQGFGDERSLAIESLFKKVGASFLEGEVERSFVADMLARIPKMVARTVKLSQVIPRKTPSDPTNFYLKQATRSYIFGFPDASVAFCRAALEQGLHEVVGEKLGQSPGKLSELLRLADRARILDKPGSHLAETVKSAGNRVLHGKRIGEREAWDVLRAARGVLETLFNTA